ASTKVGGLEHASHIGGCGFEYGLGSTSRAGIRKYRPSYVYGSSRHMRGICSSASRHIGLVSAAGGIAKPAHSVDDEPRPVPNSTRPPERWSMVAIRSATRAGWFTGGVMVTIAKPTWIRLVRAATQERKTSGAGWGGEGGGRRWSGGEA